MGHKAQYINCLAKLIDLAIELDFVERVYDLGSKEKEVTNGPNEDKFEDKEDLIKDTQYSFQYANQKGDNFDKDKSQGSHIELQEVKKDDLFRYPGKETKISTSVQKDSHDKVTEAQTIMEIEERSSKPKIEELQEDKKDENKTPQTEINRELKSGSFHCNFCGKSYMQKGSLRDHVKFSHNGEGFMCTICNHLARNKIDLTSHVDGVHGTKKYLCNICGSKFAQKTGLRTHTKAVHDKIRYNCGECTHVSTTLSSLGWHMKQKHTGIIYSCENCAFKSKTTYALERHQNGHCSSKKDYSCHHCGHISNTYESWSRHRRKKFCLSDKFKSQLERKTISCHMCDLKFTARCSMLLHVKRMHPKEKE